MNDFLIEIGKKITLARESKGMRLDDLGKLLNRSKSNISKIENGLLQSLDIGLLKQICEILEISLIELLDGYENVNYKDISVNIEVSKLFSEVLSRYKIERQKDFKKNEIANKLRTELPTQLKKTAMLSDSYKVVGSPGKGQWAEIPWVSVFDKDITDTATVGFYVVYLIREDMKGFYLSLNQGWTFYKERYTPKEGRIQINKVSNYLRQLINTPIDSFNIASIDLKGNGDLCKGYESGHIIGKYYSFEDIPSDDVLVNDLRYLLGIYSEVKGLMGNYNYERFIEELLKDNITKVDAVEMEKVEYKQQRKGQFRTISSSLNTKIQALKNERNKEIGTFGENFVFENEKRYLIENGRKDLADKVKWVSNPINGIDGSVDIKSFFLDGTPKNIEVKSSSQNTDDIFTFYITKNEIKIALENQGTYVLVLVDGISKNEHGIIEGNIVEELKDPFDTNFKTFSQTLNNGLYIEGNNYICKYIKSENNR